ncbi:MAG: peptidyl-prolyl cis-trans isomerase SurA [Lentimonas sp.]|jgi:peptidyl-prolyl cis-trans isomerase SurA
MKLTRTLSTLLFALTLYSPALKAQQQAPAEPDSPLAHLGNGIAAVAEGELITIQQLRREIEPIIPRLRVEAKNQQEFAKRIDELSKEVLQNMIDRIIIVKAAKDKGLLIPQSYIDQEYNDVLKRDFGDDRARFLEYLSSRGLTARDYRQTIHDRVIVNVMRQENRKSQSEISPERIEDFYIKNKVRFYQSEALHLRQIILTPLADEGLVPLRQTSKQIMSELQAGANFGDIARKYSQDEMSRKGGDWGWIERKDIRSELAEVAFSLQPSQYSQPVELSNTIFILYAEDKRAEMIQPISQVRDIIENVLIGQIARETQESWIQELRKNAYIRYYL